MLGVTERVEPWRRQVADAAPLPFPEELPWGEEEGEATRPFTVPISPPMGTEFVEKLDREIDEENARNDPALPYLESFEHDRELIAAYSPTRVTPDLSDPYWYLPSPSPSVSGPRPPSPTLSWEVERALLCEAAARAEIEVVAATVHQAEIDHSVEDALLTWEKRL